jgi:hypothetical protein
MYKLAQPGEQPAMFFNRAASADSFGQAEEYLQNSARLAGGIVG